MDERQVETIVRDELDQRELLENIQGSIAILTIATGIALGLGIAWWRESRTRKVLEPEDAKVVPPKSDGSSTPPAKE